MKEETIMDDRERENEERAENERLEFRGMGDSWLENFWYYHKWKVIIGLFFAFFIGVCVFQLAERDSPDIYVMYAGPKYLSATGTTNVRSALRAVVGDYNGDGEIGVGLVTLSCLTEEQIEERHEEALAESRQFVIDREANRQNIKQYDAEIFGGESVICLLDPSLYERTREAGGFVRMDEIFTEDELRGVRLYDSCGIYLSSLTGFTGRYSVFADFPEDTVLCIRKVATITAFKGRDKYEKIHKDHVDAFRRIVLYEYVPPEGTAGTAALYAPEPTKIKIIF